MKSSGQSPAGWGMGDALGAVLLATAVAVVPGFGAEATTARELALITGGLAMAPVVGQRVRHRRLHGWEWPALIALGVLVLMSAVSAVANRLPIADALSGWYGRGVGVLAIVACGVLTLGAWCLSARETWRLLRWVVVGASVCAGVLLLQWAGLGIFRSAVKSGLPGTMGNSNFAAGYLAISLCLATALALARRTGLPGPALPWLPPVIIVLGLAAADSTQGPIAALAGLLAGVGAAGLLTPAPSRLRVVGWVCLALLATLGLLLLASWAGVGPGAHVWESSSAQARIVWWRTALEEIDQHPWVGVGPDSFARGVGTAREAEYIQLRGPGHFVSAAHNVPLNLGATLGLPAMIAWVTMVVSCLTVATGRVTAPLRRRRATTPDSQSPGPHGGGVPSERWWAFAIAGGLVAYLVQAMVSIDALGLLALGSVLMGLSLGMGRAADAPAPDTRTRWGWVAACAVVALGLQLPGVVGTLSATGPARLQASGADTRVPCALRVGLLVPRTQTDLALKSAQAREAAARDPTCPDLLGVAALLTFKQGNAVDALPLAQQAVAADPLNARWWAVVAAAESATGSSAASASSFAEARRLAKLSPRRQQRSLVPFIDALAAPRTS